MNKITLGAVVSAFLLLVSCIEPSIPTPTPNPSPTPTPNPSPTPTPNPTLTALLKQKLQGNLTDWNQAGLSIEVKAISPTGASEVLDTVPVSPSGQFTLTQKAPAQNTTLTDVQKIDVLARDYTFCNFSNVATSATGAMYANIELTLLTRPIKVVEATTDNLPVKLVYVSQDVLVTGYQQCQPNREPRRTTTLNLPLKRGWNAISRMSTFTGSEFTDTLKSVPLPTKYFVTMP